MADFAVSRVVVQFGEMVGLRFVSQEQMFERMWERFVSVELALLLKGCVFPVFFA